MAQRARLITPQGKKIDLPPAVYRQITVLLNAPSRRCSRQKMDKAIKSTYGKYAAGTPLTQALLEERAADNARESEKMKRLHG